MIAKSAESQIGKRSYINLHRRRWIAAQDGFVCRALFADKEAPKHRLSISVSGLKRLAWLFNGWKVSVSAVTLGVYRMRFAAAKWGYSWFQPGAVFGTAKA